MGAMLRDEDLAKILAMVENYTTVVVVWRDSDYDKFQPPTFVLGYDDFIQVKTLREFAAMQGWDSGVMGCARVYTKEAIEATTEDYPNRWVVVSHVYHSFLPPKEAPPALRLVEGCSR